MTGREDKALEPAGLVVEILLRPLPYFVCLSCSSFLNKTKVFLADDNIVLFGKINRMPHIHTEPGQHDSTVSAYIVFRDKESEPKLILHKHKKLGQFLQFGGHIELDENPWQALAHELEEESGYDISQLQLLQPPVRLKGITGATLHPYPVSYLTHQFADTEHYHTDTGYAFVADQKALHAVGEGESSEICLFTEQELHDLSSEEIPENVREIGLFVLTVCLKEWELVPVPELNA